jgi:N-acyl homoserine lactone hydrolase
MPRSVAPAGTRFIVQHHGNMHMDGRRMAGVPHYFQTASDRTPRDMWVPVPCLTFVVRHAEAVVLFDLGCPEDWATRWKATGIDDLVPYDEWTSDQTLQATLAAQGMTVNDIDVVVLSHLHMDHCGNLQLFEKTRADIVLQRAEHTGAMALPDPGRAGYVTSQYRDVDVRWKLIEGDHDLMPGLEILALPGHSYGSQGMTVNLRESGLFVLASDAAQVAPNMASPPIASPNVYDSMAWRKSIARLRRLRDEEGGTVIFGHEPSQLADLRLAPDYYL